MKALARRSSAPRHPIVPDSLARASSTSHQTRCFKNYVRFGSKSLVSSIRDELVALDTNEYIFALRGDARYPACETSENRHFLAELPTLPFTVLTSEEALQLLDKLQ